MIPTEQNIINEQSGIETTVNFSVKNKNFGHLFHILRNQTYSNPIMAVCREYATNACDAHIEAGKANEPIQISLPNNLDCFFKVRDFGLGLNDEEIKDIYASYGESTKRQSQDFNGMLGIGCKSGFAYNDSFMINSYKDGKLTVWNAYIDPSNQGAMSKMAETETTEPNGIEVIIPVKRNDIHLFKKNAFDIYQFFKIEPKLMNVDEFDLKEFKLKRERVPVISGTNWNFFGGKKSYAIMGNVAYPIDSYTLSDPRFSSELQSIVNEGINLNFKIGELEFAASREQLQYTELTKTNLIAALKAAHSEISAFIKTKFSNCSTLWEAKKIFSEIFSISGKLYCFRGYAQRNFQFNGKEISEDYFRLDYYNANLRDMIGLKAFIYCETNNGLSRNPIGRIAPNEKVVIVENDLNLTRGIGNYIASIVKGQGKSVTLITFKDAEERKVWFDYSGYDGPMVKISSLKKEPLTTYFPNLNPKKEKNLIQEFVLSSGVNFIEAEINPSLHRGVYIPLYSMKPVKNNGDKVDIYTLRSYLNYLKELGIKIPTIYGFRPNSTKKAIKNKNMINFFDWMNKKVTQFVKNNPNLEKMAVEAAAFINVVDSNQELILKLISVRDTQSPFTIFRDEFLPLFDPDKKLGMLTDLMNAVGYTSSFASSSDFHNKLEPIIQRYPLIFLTFINLPSHTRRDPKIIKLYEDYILAIDRMEKP